jgi:hypothetical protein
VENNALECVPPELADLQALVALDVRRYCRAVLSFRLTILAAQWKSALLAPRRARPLASANLCLRKNVLDPGDRHRSLTRCLSVARQSLAAERLRKREHAPSPSRALLNNDSHRHDPRTRRYRLLCTARSRTSGAIDS